MRQKFIFKGLIDYFLIDAWAELCNGTHKDLIYYE